MQPSLDRCREPSRRNLRDAPGQSCRRPVGVRPDQGGRLRRRLTPTTSTGTTSARTRPRVRCREDERVSRLAVAPPRTDTRPSRSVGAHLADSPEPELAPRTLSGERLNSHRRIRSDESGFVPVEPYEAEVLRKLWLVLFELVQKAERLEWVPISRITRPSRSSTSRKPSTMPASVSVAAPPKTRQIFTPPWVITPPVERYGRGTLVTRSPQGARARCRSQPLPHEDRPHSPPQPNITAPRPGWQDRPRVVRALAHVASDAS